MIPSWSDKHPNKRAQKIYNRAWMSALVVIGLAFLVLFVLLLLLLIRFNWPDGIEAGILGAGVIVSTAIAHARGVAALRRAGLVREETEIIERTATTFAGEPLEVRGSSMAVRAGFIIFFGLLSAAGAWLFQSSPFDPLYGWGGGAIAFLFGSIALLMLAHAGKPELRMDERGILSCQNWTSARLVRWDEIARLESKRVWGLPPHYEPTENSFQTVALCDADGKPLLILQTGHTANDPINALVTGNADSFALKNAKPSQNQLFIAEIGRRLQAATAPDSEEVLP